MRKWLIIVPLIVMQIGATGAAPAPCPERKPGQAYPWQKADGLLPDDEWAYLYIDLDAKGRPTNCRVGKHKYKPETGFFMCRAMMAQGQFEPVLRDGVPVAGTVTRFFTMAGRTRQKADKLARKQYFAQHPHERPGCYP